MLYMSTISASLIDAMRGTYDDARTGNVRVSVVDDGVASLAGYSHLIDQNLGKVIAERDLLLRVGGAMNAIGEPALNNSGVIAFPAAILKGPVLGGNSIARSLSA